MFIRVTATAAGTSYRDWQRHLLNISDIVSVEDFGEPDEMRPLERTIITMRANGQSEDGADRQVTYLCQQTFEEVEALIDQALDQSKSEGLPGGFRR